LAPGESKDGMFASKVEGQSGEGQSIVASRHVELLPPRWDARRQFALLEVKFSVKVSVLGVTAFIF
jgi:hypothetical protein